MFNENTTDANRKTIDDLTFFDQTSVVEPDCEGTPEQALLSGVINANDMIGDGVEMTDELYIQACFYNYVNMGHAR